MEAKYYRSLLYSEFYQWGSDLIFNWMLLLPYKSILSIGHTCKYMYVRSKEAATRKEFLIKENAYNDIKETLHSEGYLAKLEELSLKHPRMLLAGDFILSKMTSVPFSSKYIDVYIGDGKPCDERAIITSLTDHFVTRNESETRFKVIHQKTKFGYTTISISLKSCSIDSKILCIHLNCGPCIPKYIESKFDLTCSMVWFDMREIYTNRFWQQVNGIGYINNSYYIEETGIRIIRFMDTYGFHILNSDEFNWEVYYYDDNYGYNSYDHMEEADSDNEFAYEYDTSNSD